MTIPMKTTTQILISLALSSILSVGVVGAPLQQTHLEAESWFKQGQDQIKAGNPSQAVKDLNRALKLNPAHAQAYYLRGVLFSKHGKPALAVSDLTHSMKLSRPHPYAFFFRGRSHYDLGNLQAAVDDFDQAEIALHAMVHRTQEAQSPSLEFGGSMGDFVARKMGMNASESLGSVSNINDALSTSDYFEMKVRSEGYAAVARATAPGILKDNAMLAELYLVRAEAHLGLERSHEAVRDYARGLGVNEDSTRRGLFDYLNGEYDEAFKTLRKGIRTIPRKERDLEYLWLYLTRRQLGETDEADAWLRGLLPKMKGRREGKLATMIAQYFLGDTQREQFIDSLVSSDPSVTAHNACEALFYEAQLCLLRNERKRANFYLKNCRETGLKNSVGYRAALTQSLLIARDLPPN